MKKPTTWQIVLLVIFYPIGIIYLILYLVNKNKNQTKINDSSSVLWTVDKSIMGSTYSNPDGSSRQEIIKNLKVGEDIIFKPAPIKDYPDLIGAFTKKNKQIGSVPYDVVNTIKNQYAGYPMTAKVKEVTYYGDHYLCYVTINVYKK